MVRGPETGRPQRWQFWLAVGVSAVVPSVVISTLWANLAKPFWYNEVWRAYFISKPGDWWAALKADNSPFPAGWYLLERASGWIFGSTEVALRLPTALFLPLNAVLLLLLARRWMPLAAATALSVVGAVTGEILVFSVQLAEYPVDAAAAVAVVLGHEVAWDGGPVGWRSGRVYLAYAGIALACIFSTPAVFVAAPLLMVDTIRAVRARAEWPRAVAAAGSGLLILLHLGLFVVRQNAQTNGSYWNAYFAPHHGVARQVTFVWDRLKGFVSGMFTPTSRLPTLLGIRWSGLLTACFAILLVLGVIECARSQRGRYLLLGIGGSQVLTLVASYVRYWPFGFTRTNYYLLPLLILLAGIGGAGPLARVARARSSRPRPSRDGRRILLIIVGTAVAAMSCIVFGMATSYEVSSYRYLHNSAGSAGYGEQIGFAVDAVDNRARSGAAVVVAGAMAIQGWEYYQFDHGGHPSGDGAPLGPGQVLFVSKHGSPSITHLVDTLHSHQIFLYIPWGVSGAEFRSDLRAIGSGRTCHPLWHQNFRGSGLLTEVVCTNRPVAGPKGLANRRSPSSLRRREVPA